MTPSVTASPTQPPTLTPRPATLPPTLTPGLILMTRARPPTSTPFFGVTPSPQSGNAAFLEPGAPPTAPSSTTGQPGAFGPVGPADGTVVMRQNGQIVPLSVNSQPAYSAALRPTLGDVFAEGANGRYAWVDTAGELHTNAGVLSISPASQFGMPADLVIRDMVWSPDGQQLAFRVDPLDPHQHNANQGGVWIYNPDSQQSWQVLRNRWYQITATQMEQAFIARRIRWSPDGRYLIIGGDTGTRMGQTSVFTEPHRRANEQINPATDQFYHLFPYSDATWAPDSTSLIVSGPEWNGASVIGRITLPNTRYTEYFNEASTGLVMRAAVELPTGQLAFLGSPTGAASFALYTARPGGQLRRASGTITGEIVTAEWNAARTAVLVTVRVGPDAYQLWTVPLNGPPQNITPPEGVPEVARWQAAP
jgi:hypothetical protein